MNEHHGALAAAASASASASTSEPAACVLHPGDVACGTRGDRFETLLGSCVAVLMTDPRRTIGVMCHIVHPGGDPEGDPCFGAAAFARMHRLLADHNIVPRLCQAWVVGGGNMFPDRYAKTHVGDANARWVLRTLVDGGVHVVGHDLGGPRYRRVHWTVGPGGPRVTSVALDDVKD